MTHLQIVDLQIKLEKMVPALRATGLDLYKIHGRLVHNTFGEVASDEDPTVLCSAMIFLTKDAAFEGASVPIGCAVTFESRFFGEIEIAERLLNAIERLTHEEPRLVREYVAAQRTQQADPAPIAAPCREAKRAQLPPSPRFDRSRRIASLCRDAVRSYWRRRQRGAALR